MEEGNKNHYLASNLLRKLLDVEMLKLFYFVVAIIALKVCTQSFQQTIYAN